MHAIRFSILTLILISLTACGGGAAKAQKRAYKAQERVAKERLELVEQYRKCINAAGDDSLRYGACDSYLNAAEALK